MANKSKANKYNLYQRANGLYVKTVQIGNERKYFTSMDADEVMQKYYAFINHTEHGYTFSEVATQYKDAKFDSLVDGTYKVYLPAYNHVVDWFGDKYIKYITPADVNIFIKSCEKQYAYKTIANRKTILTQIFDYAIIELRVPIYNPCERIAISKGLPKSTRNTLTAEQLQIIKATTPDEFILAFLILYTGTRCGEALTIQLKDIDFEDNTILIKEAVHHKGNKPYIGKLKTNKSYRTIPLLKPLKDMLLITTNNLSPNSYIIGGDFPITKSMLKRRWDKYCYEHGMAHIEYRKYNYSKTPVKIYVTDIDRHTLRHEYATMLYEAGVDMKTAQELLGHADISTTMDIYTHFRNNQLKATTDTLNQHILTKT